MTFLSVTWLNALRLSVEWRLLSAYLTLCFKRLLILLKIRVGTFSLID